MRQMSTTELEPGIVIAQHILNEDGAILLTAGSTLTAKAIASLLSWNIQEVRIKEDKDTDEDLAMALQFDEITRQHSQSADEEASVSIDIPPQTPIPSIINEKSLEQYETISHRFLEILRNRKLYTDPAKLDSLANIICRYVLSTPGAIGYALRQEEEGGPVELLARHSLAVAVIATKLARLLRYPSEQIQNIAIGALIHDIGKMLLPPQYSETAASRTEHDNELYRSHVQIGYDLLKQYPFPREAMFVLLQHHETIDGSGFPLCLPPGKMHPYAQVVALANRFDVLFHEQAGLPNLFDIRPRLLKSAATKISTEIVDIFDRYLEDFVFTANVELSDGRTAEVIYTHHAFESPVVKASDGELIDLNHRDSLKVVRLSL
ncbi:HD-GYP domain-containing protein [Azotosporobacter soli]|uniref:HD-GYP domain-containing protein n=1 Tax=Azotosporobacter soli TaxID=3055040 RepID=UPI0031FECF32